MKCPSCHAPLPEPLPQCPNCELTLERLDRKFGLVPLFSRHVSDRTGKLSARDIEQLRGLLNLFERKFPQILFSIMLVNLPGMSVSEYAFWLINRARFGTLGAVGPKNFELLLLVDPESRNAALTTGYGLENYLEEQDLENCLGAAGGSFRAGDLVGGIRACVEYMMNRLREIAVGMEKAKSLVEEDTVSAATIQ